MNSKPLPGDGLRLQRGFTLLEVLVSVAIIAIVLVSIVRLQGQTILMNESFRFYTVAPLLAQSKLSEVLQDPSGIDMSSSGDFGDDYPGYTWTIDSADVTINMDEDTEMALKQIDITISLNNGEIKYTFRQFIEAEAGV